MQIVLYSPQLRHIVREFKLVGARKIVSPYKQKTFVTANFITGEENNAIMKAIYAKPKEQKETIWW